jgi:hypothetical protein
MSDVDIKLEKAKSALLESLASGIADDADTAWLDSQIAQFNAHVCKLDGDVGDDGIEIRKAA